MHGSDQAESKRPWFVTAWFLTLVVAIMFGWLSKVVVDNSTLKKPVAVKVDQKKEPSSLVNLMPFGREVRQGQHSVDLATFLLNSVSRSAYVIVPKYMIDGTVEYDMSGSMVPRPQLDRLAKAGTIWALCELMSDGDFYYKCLGFENRKQVLLMMGAGKERRQAFPVGSSKVTLLDRVFSRRDAAWGGHAGFIWESSCLAPSAKDPTGPPSVMNELEGFGTLPNGLLAYWVCDGDGRLMLQSDPKMFMDNSTSGLDTIVSVPMSCIGCHLPTGPREFNGDPKAFKAGAKGDRVRFDILDGEDNEAMPQLLFQDMRIYGFKTQTMPSPLAALRALDFYRVRSK